MMGQFEQLDQMLGYGNVAFFDLSFKWALIFSVIGITGVIMTFLPDKK